MVGSLNLNDWDDWDDLHVAPIPMESQAGGTVRITAIESITTHILVPQLRKLWQEAPHLAIELLPGPNALNIARHQAHMAIHLSRPTEEGTVIRHIGDIGFGLYTCCREEPDLQTCPWITYDDSLKDKPEAQWSATLRGNAPVVLRSCDINTIREAIAQGHGVGVLPCFIGHRSPRLRRLATASPPPTRPVWLAMPEALQHTPPMKTATNWVEAVFHRLKPTLLGL